MCSQPFLLNRVQYQKPSPNRITIVINNRIFIDINLTMRSIKFMFSLQFFLNIKNHYHKKVILFSFNFFLFKLCRNIEEEKKKQYDYVWFPIWIYVNLRITKPKIPSSWEFFNFLWMRNVALKWYFRKIFFIFMLNSLCGQTHSS